MSYSNQLLETLSSRRSKTCQSIILASNIVNQYLLIAENIFTMQDNILTWFMAMKTMTAWIKIFSQPPNYDQTAPVNRRT